MVKSSLPAYPGAIPVTGGDVPGQPEEPDYPSDPFGYADEWVGDCRWYELEPAEEDYRHRAYEAVLHLVGDFGIPVFPVWHMATEKACACKEGLNCQRRAKHPVDFSWPEMATFDPEQAARWWRKLEPGEEDQITDWRPRANVGLLMGVKHFLLDVDMGEDQQGDASLTALISHYGEDLTHTLMYSTGGGGRQHVFLLPEGVEVRNSVSLLGDNLDIRGYNGFGIAPPSRSGKGEYRGVVDTKPMLPPRWLADWLVEQQRKRTERIQSRPKGGKTRPLPPELSIRSQRYIRAALANAVQQVSEAPNRDPGPKIGPQLGRRQRPAARSVAGYRGCAG